ncbi:phage integrase N-terminal SAM-like domain-containing protein [Pleionea litopenaei]|uniref:Phage integrase N-terminal SAM-like domain-containing protein n=1 Tax=Pleionea litopenaei TaxID=3070815 RepID=A0AA51X6T8_9GAMM|nr:phage integrase N-terminal SAM-like domain-containing protein [Pleionea sp. HL-JVS1]WMS87204.1 phage integrase N-terminal SAM-like domain-containing protein [Pleionea sp. HL-JVS1]
MEDKQQVFAKVVEAFKLHRFKRSDAQEYLNWIKLFLNHNKHVPTSQLTANCVKEFLRYLCDDKGLMPSRQKQAYLAINFFYNQVLQRSLWSTMNFGEEVDLQAQVNPLTTATEHQAPEWTNLLQEPFRTVAKLSFHCGLKLDEVLNLRVEDVDVQRHVLKIRDAFGDFSEIDIASDLMQSLTLQLRKAMHTHQQDLRQGEVFFRNPSTLRRGQLTDNARWYFLFPGTLQFNLHTQKRVRESLDANVVEQAFSQARTRNTEQVAPFQIGFKQQASL